MPERHHRPSGVIWAGNPQGCTVVSEIDTCLERVSKMPPERDPEASEVEEGAVGGE